MGEPDDNDLLEVNIPKFEGTHRMEGLGISNDQFLSPLKVKKVNIGSQMNPKFSNIRDYWDDETIGNITELLHEFQDLFPTKFSEMKGILGDMGEIKIHLRPDAKPIKKQPYQLNPWYKDKFKTKLDQMLDASIIDPIK